MDAGTDWGGFKGFEAEGWSRKAASYDRLTGRATAQLIAPLLDAVALAPGMQILDVGCGLGYIAAAAAARGAVPVGLDAAPGMIAEARRRHPQIEFEEGDAEGLPFEDGTFDAVVGGCVLNHLPRPDRALAEFVRVLRPGASAAATVWDRPERMRLIGVVAEAIQQAQGVRDPGIPRDGPDPYRFADDAAFTALLSEAGLDGARVHTIEFEQPVSSTDELWEGMLGGTVRTSTVIERQETQVVELVRGALDHTVSPYRGETGIALPVAAKLGSGRRP